MCWYVFVVEQEVSLATPHRRTWFPTIESSETRKTTAFCCLLPRVLYWWGFCCYMHVCSLCVRQWQTSEEDVLWTLPRSIAQFPCPFCVWCLIRACYIISHFSSIKFFSCFERISFWKLNVRSGQHSDLFRMICLLLHITSTNRYLSAFWLVRLCDYPHYR